VRERVRVLWIDQRPGGPKGDSTAESDRIQRARQAYEAYETEDRSLIETLLAADLAFFAPPDPGIDRAAYFERCWPNAGHIEAFEFIRLREAGADKVLVTMRRRGRTAPGFATRRSSSTVRRSRGSRSTSVGTCDQPGRR
jgi:hypothetical protein